jgi:hypothetical protein
MTTADVNAVAPAGWGRFRTDCRSASSWVLRFTAALGPHKLLVTDLVLTRPPAQGPDDDPPWLHAYLTAFARRRYHRADPTTPGSGLIVGPLVTSRNLSRAEVADLLRGGAGRVEVVDKTLWPNALKLDAMAVQARAGLGQGMPLS